MFFMPTMNKIEKKKNRRDFEMKGFCDIGEVLDLSPFHRKGTPLPVRIGSKLVSPYKIALVVLDFFLMAAGFIIIESLSGRGLNPGDDLRRVCSIVIIAVILISFFSEYRLYNYHLIFSKRKHLHELIKALCLGVLSLGITVLIFRWPEFLAGRFALSGVFLGALGLMLLT